MKIQTDYWITGLLKSILNGIVKWQNTIGGNDEEILTSMIQVTDGSYLIGGYSESNISGDKTENSNGMEDYWIVKLDSSGFIQWQNTIGGVQDDVLNSIIQTIDGGFLLGGWSNSNISGDKSENALTLKIIGLLKRIFSEMFSGRIR